ncbi:MAG: hypothetical protein RLZZ340_592, partial [Actinomycetota bacterium]
GASAGGGSASSGGGARTASSGATGGSTTNSSGGSSSGSSSGSSGGSASAGEGGEGEGGDLQTLDVEHDEYEVEDERWGDKLAMFNFAFMRITDKPAHDIAVKLAC